MKKLKLVSALALASLTLFSCSSDDDSSSSSVSIKGIWKIHEVKLNGNINQFTDCEGSQTVQFTDVNIIATTYTGDDCTTVDDVTTSTYTIDGNNLSIIDFDGTVNATIKELTASTLKVSTSQELSVIESTFKR